MLSPGKPRSLGVPSPKARMYSSCLASPIDCDTAIVPRLDDFARIRATVMVSNPWSVASCSTVS